MSHPKMLAEIWSINRTPTGHTTIHFFYKLQNFEVGRKQTTLITLFSPVSHILLVLWLSTSYLEKYHVLMFPFFFFLVLFLPFVLSLVCHLIVFTCSVLVLEVFPSFVFVFPHQPQNTITSVKHDGGSIILRVNLGFLLAPLTNPHFILSLAFGILDAVFFLFIIFFLGMFSN